MAARSAAQTAEALGARVIRHSGEGMTFEERSGGRIVARTVTNDARGEEHQRTLDARAVVLASGTEPAIPDVIGLPDVRTFTTATLAEANELPESLLVLGGGPTGCEQALAFARRKARVTIVEAQERLLHGEESCAGEAVTRALTQAGVRVLVGGTVTKVSPTLDGGVYAGTEVGGDVAATHLLLATGRRGALGGLALSAIGLVTQHGRLPVDETLATGVHGVYAAGDVTGIVEGDHSDAVMGRVAATNALAATGGGPLGARLSRLLNRQLGPRPSHGRSRQALAWQPHAVPVLVATEPQVARVGHTLDSAQTAAAWGRDLRDVRMSDGALPDGAKQDGALLADALLADASRAGHLRAGAASATETDISGGLALQVRVITAETGSGRHARRVVVGATIVGPGAAELIALPALAVQARIGLDSLETLMLPSGTAARAVVELLARG